jgi:hypothetical protein
MAKIQDILNNQHKYKVDLTYQRPVGAWSNEDNACLIDTILKGEPIPLFFLNYNSLENIFYIVDGQQRLHAIRQFFENKAKLNKKFSGVEKHGQSFNGDLPISDDDRNKFLNYELKIHLVEDYNDERIRLIFSRLQRGKPLQLGERLNANAGSIVKCMREIAKHPFMSKSIGVAKNRYGTYPDAARILFYEKFNSRQMGSSELYEFFDKHKELDMDDRDVKRVMSTLNFLEKCFPSDPGDYKFLEKHAWVLSVYSMVRDLNRGYSLQNKENDIRVFIEEFHNKVYNEMFRQSNPNYQRFYDNVRGGWSERIITLRKTILIQEFCKKYNLDELDDRRQISNEEKVEVFSEHNCCEMCKIKFKDYKDPEYHHKKRFTDGGKTEIDNIMVLCQKCHDEIHGKGKIELPTEDEKTEGDY